MKARHTQHLITDHAQEWTVADLKAAMKLPPDAVIIVNENSDEHEHQLDYTDTITVRYQTKTEVTTK